MGICQNCKSTDCNGKSICPNCGFEQKVAYEDLYYGKDLVILEKEEPWGFFQTAAWYLLIIIIIKICRILSGSIFYLYGYIRSDYDGTEFLNLMHQRYNLLALTMILSTLAVLPFVKYICDKKYYYKKYLMLHRPVVDHVFFGLISTMLMLMIAFIINKYFNIIDYGAKTAHKTRSLIDALFFYPASIVFAPILEEVIYRGFLLKPFEDTKIKRFIGIVIVSFFWSIGHQATAPSNFIWFIFIFGIFLGIFKFKTKSLFVPICMHCSWNLFLGIFPDYFS